MFIHFAKFSRPYIYCLPTSIPEARVNMIKLFSKAILHGVLLCKITHIITPFSRPFSRSFLENSALMYSRTVCNQERIIRGATGTAGLPKPDKATITRWCAATFHFFQNPGKTEVLPDLPPVASLVLMVHVRYLN